MPWAQHVVTFEELISPQLVNSKCNCVLVIGDNGAWRLSVELDEKGKYREHCLCCLVNHSRDFSSSILMLVSVTVNTPTRNLLLS